MYFKNPIWEISRGFALKVSKLLGFTLQTERKCGKVQREIDVDTVCDVFRKQIRGIFRGFAFKLCQNCLLACFRMRECVVARKTLCATYFRKKIIVLGFWSDRMFFTVTLWSTQMRLQIAQDTSSCIHTYMYISLYIPVHIYTYLNAYIRYLHMRIFIYTLVSTIFFMYVHFSVSLTVLLLLLLPATAAAALRYVCLRRFPAIGLVFMIFNVWSLLPWEESLLASKPRHGLSRQGPGS